MKTNVPFLKSRWSTRHIVYGVMIFIPTFFVVGILNKYILKNVFSIDTVTIASLIICFIRGILPICRFYFFDNCIEVRFLFFRRKKIYLKDIKHIDFFAEARSGDYCRIYTNEKKWIRKILNRFVYVIELKNYSFNEGGQYYKLLLFYLEKDVKIKIETVYDFYNRKNNDLKHICQIDNNGFLLKNDF